MTSQITLPRNGRDKYIKEFRNSYIVCGYVVLPLD